MQDLQNRSDVELLVRTFYGKATQDEVIGFLFTDVAQLDLETHFPTMFDFWEGILFNKPLYKGGMMYKHILLNQKHPLEAKHFDRWLELWITTVNELFAGPIADEAIRRGNLVAITMKYKMAHINSGANHPMS